MKTFLQTKLVTPLLALLKQGVTPGKLALAVSLGITIATIPVFGATTLVCLAVIPLFRLNPGAILLVNQFAYPLQFILYIPLIRAGEWLFHKKALLLSVSQVFQLFKSNLLRAISTLWWSTLYALIAWLLVAIPLTWLLYSLLTPLFVKIKRAGTPSGTQ
ncbi:hypothetical protein SAMN05421788_105279 [Filimonas lacunae]|uniref:DUF2062 domain-containing protein n=1 Tax=Filimonas lacunae TaxID=477680 RepID=A0A173MCG5_9BACT|nr:DUF2062 domain-containing protein [Filimonas lacunae]BAV05262.1 hypothetical protein FLA_1269 [Filimonas lacunae]SIT22330.1 hypothetical protein SAMN05421788_105279 [Filimonas lacunae]